MKSNISNRILIGLTMLFILMTVAQQSYGACLPRSTFMPPGIMQGSITCLYGSTPSDVVVESLMVDGSSCSSDNWDFELLANNQYKLSFWIDFAVAHEVSICVSAKCGPDLFMAGFSPDGSTPGTCNVIMDFPEYEFAVGADIIFDEDSSTSYHQFELCPGMNLVSLPLSNPGLATAGQLLDNICDSNADIIWKYNCSTASFDSWTILDPGDGWATYPGMPFYVNITGITPCYWNVNGSIPASISFSLCRGLNVVSLPLNQVYIDMASDLLNDIPNCTAVWRYRKEISCSSPPLFDGYFTLSLPSEDYSLQQAYSYWVSVSNTTTWTCP